MPLHLHNISEETHKDESTGQEQKFVRCNFYLPFMREGAVFSLPVEEFPPKNQQEAILLKALHEEIGKDRALRDQVMIAIQQEKDYLQGQIQTHEKHRQQCVDRLKLLENPFLEG